MKKVLIGLALLITISLIAVYTIIPGKLQLDATTTINAAIPGVFRSLSNDSTWKRWWPGETLFSFHDKKFIPGEKIYNSIGVVITSKDHKIDSRLDLLLVKADIMTVEWHAEQSNSKNPLKRFSLYMQTASIQEDMEAILASLKAFMEKTENIYGMPITENIVTDSVLISTKQEFSKKPEPGDIDKMIQRLKKYIADNGAIEKNYPMLNILQLDQHRFETMVAIPVDRRLPDTKDFAAKFLLKGGNILEAEIKGGPATIENAFSELENFRTDYKFTSPAIPYQLLLTDRIKEPDTLKWITKLYYPVF